MEVGVGHSSKSLSSLLTFDHCFLLLLPTLPKEAIFSKNDLCFTSITITWWCILELQMHSRYWKCKILGPHSVPTKSTFQQDFQVIHIHRWVHIPQNRHFLYINSGEIMITHNVLGSFFWNFSEPALHYKLSSVILVNLQLWKLFIFWSIQKFLRADLVYKIDDQVGKILILDKIIHDCKICMVYKPFLKSASKREFQNGFQQSWNLLDLFPTKTPLKENAYLNMHILKCLNSFHYFIKHFLFYR